MAMICPWCELEIVPVNTRTGDDECPECQTTWRYEDDEATALPLAA